MVIFRRHVGGMRGVVQNIPSNGVQHFLSDIGRVKSGVVVQQTDSFWESEGFCDCFMQQGFGVLRKHCRKYIQSRFAIVTAAFSTFHKFIIEIDRLPLLKSSYRIRTEIFKLSTPLVYTRTIHMFFVIEVLTSLKILSRNFFFTTR